MTRALPILALAAAHLWVLALIIPAAARATLEAAL